MRLRRLVQRTGPRVPRSREASDRGTLGFGVSIPTGEGLFAFTTLDECVDAIARVETDYRRHCGTAHIAVLRRPAHPRQTIADLGLG